MKLKYPIAAKASEAVFYSPEILYKKLPAASYDSVFQEG
jgi:hypothetical protein